MEKLFIPAQAIPYIEALRDLIRTGAQASPTLESSRLITLPVVLQRAGLNASPAKKSHIFITLLQYVIKHRLEGKDKQAGLILFAFENYAGLPIQDRYRAVAKLYSRYWTWENYRKEPLTRHLLAVYLALRREAELFPMPPHFDAKPKAPQIGLIGQDWVLESFEESFNFPSNENEPLEVLQTRRLRAISQEVNIWRHDAYWRERGVAGVPEVILFGPGTVDVIDSYFDSGSGLRVFVTEVVFSTPIHYGESVEFTLVKRVHVKLAKLTQGKDWYGLTTLKSPTDFARISLQFPPNLRPKSIWRQEDIIHGLIRPGEPSKETQLTIDKCGHVTTAWQDLSAGCSYGISLLWN